MKKILIITYYWPPSGGIGVNRCLKFARYLRKYGWEPVIYTAENPDYPYLDIENEKQVPEGIEVLKHKIIEPFRFYKFFSGKGKNEAMTNPIHARDGKRKLINNISIWIRGNFFIPDARSLWIKPSVKFLSKYLEKNKIDALLTDGPPHTNTVIACRLSQKFDIPWLADFQDPWTQVDYYKLFKLTRWADKKHHRLEQETFATAKKMTIASPTWKKDLEAIGAKNVDVIFWGYDEQDFNEIDPVPSNKFTLYHAGMFGFDRHAGTLFEVLKELKEEINGFDKDLEIKLAGFIDYSIIQSIEQNGLKENLNNLGAIPRKKALQHTLESHILLLLINKADNALGRIPGKLFELMRANRSILALGDEGSDVQKIITKSNAGTYCEYDNKETIKNYLKEQYANYKQGSKKSTLLTKNIEEYSVENQTKKIASYLDSIIEI